MALTKALQVFGEERPVVNREQIRRQYSGLEYLLAKVVAEIPLDTVFSVVFTTTLKAVTGVRIGWGQLTAVFSLMTVAGASLGYAIAGWSKKGDTAMAMGLPLMVVLMAVGIINPSGVDKSSPPPAFVRWIKMMSPIRWAIEALCVGEFRGIDLRPDRTNQRGFLFSKRLGMIKDLPKMGAFAMVENGDQILDALALKDADFGTILCNLALLSAANLAVSLIGLEVTTRSQRWQQQKSTKTDHPKEAPREEERSNDKVSTSADTGKVVNHNALLSASKSSNNKGLYAPMKPPLVKPM